MARAAVPPPSAKRHAFSRNTLAACGALTKTGRSPFTTSNHEVFGGASRAPIGFAVNAVGEDKLTVFADRGYFKGEEILDCEQPGIKTLVPKPQTSGNKAAGLFDKADFRYIPPRMSTDAPRGVCRVL